MNHLLAFHGWAHDPGSWSRLKELLVSGIELSAANRGYFNEEPAIPDFPKKAEKVVLIVHADGLQHVPQEWFQKADGLILCSCYIKPGKDAGLNRMLQSLTFNTALSLGQFHANCAYPMPSKFSMPRRFSLPRLKQDLESLKNKSFDVRMIDRDKPMLILNGDSDKIIPKKQLDELPGLLGKNQKIIKKAGHGFIYTHPLEYIGLVEEFVQNL